MQAPGGWHNAGQNSKYEWNDRNWKVPAGATDILPSCIFHTDLRSSAMYTYLKPGGLLYTWSNVNLRIDPGSQRLSVTFNLEKYLFASLSDMIFEKKRKERANRDIFDLQRFLFFGT